MSLYSWPEQRLLKASRKDCYVFWYLFLLKLSKERTSLVVQWLRLCTSNVWCTGSILSHPHTMQPKKVKWKISKETIKHFLSLPGDVPHQSWPLFSPSAHFLTQESVELTAATLVLSLLPPHPSAVLSAQGSVGVVPFPQISWPFLLHGEARGRPRWVSGDQSRSKGWSMDLSGPHCLHSSHCFYSQIREFAM